MKTKLAILAVAAIVAMVATGCRANSNTTQNYVTLSGTAGAVYMAGFEFGRGNNDATQAADKKVGDIAPKANVAAGPLSKATEAGTEANAGATGPATP